MQRKFILNLILLLFLNLLIKPFYVFFIDMNVQRVVGLSEYGIYLAIFNFTYVINIILDMGITNFNNRNIAQNSHLLGKYFPPIVMIRIMLGVLYLVVAFVLALFMHYDVRQLRLLGVLAFNQFLLSFILYLRSNISGLLHFVTDSFVSVLDRVLMILFCLIMLYTKYFQGRFSIEWFAYAQTLSYVITAIVAFLIVVKDAGFRKPKFNKALFLLILKKSFPFALLTLLMSCYNKIDTVMMKQMISGTMGSEQVGIYAHSSRVLDAMNNFSYLFAVLLLPLYSRMLKSKENVGGITKTAFGILMCFSFTISTMCMYYGFEIMDLMYDVEIDCSAKVFRVLMYCFPSMSFGYVFGTLLTANGSLKHLNIISLCGLTVNVLLNVILIPRYGAVGAAYTGVITQAFVVICQIIVSKNVFHVTVDRKLMNYIISSLAFLVLIFIAGFCITKLGISWYVKCLVHLFVGVIIAIIFRVFDVRELIQLVKKK